MTAALPMPIVDAHFAASEQVAADFFTHNAEHLSQVCLAMARHFRQGGRLLVLGDGDTPQRSDAHHVAVEFVHPVIVGKRALPALALEAPAQLAALGRVADIALGISADAGSAGLHAALHAARARGLLTVHLAGGDDAVPATADHVLAVAANDALVVQEVHETAYHVLWELVHVFFEREVV